MPEIIGQIGELQKFISLSRSVVLVGQMQVEAKKKNSVHKSLLKWRTNNRHGSVFGITKCTIDDGIQLSNHFIIIIIE